MNRILITSTLAAGFLLLSADFNAAQAQYGYYPTYVPRTCARVPAYSTGYRAVTPYGLSYRTTSYGSPGLAVTRYYAAPSYRYTVDPRTVQPYGLGGYGNLGYPPIQPVQRGVPRVQLRIGF